MELSDGCAADYVELRELDNLSNVIGRYCGNTVPAAITVTKSVHMKFRSNLDGDYSGFLAQFSTGSVPSCSLYLLILVFVL